MNEILSIKNIRHYSEVNANFIPSKATSFIQERQFVLLPSSVGPQKSNAVALVTLNLMLIKLVVGDTTNAGLRG